MDLIKSRPISLHSQLCFFSYLSFRPLMCPNIVVCSLYGIAFVCVGMVEEVGVGAKCGSHGRSTVHT